MAQAGMGSADGAGRIYGVDGVARMVVGVAVGCFFPVVDILDIWKRHARRFELRLAAYSSRAKGLASRLIPNVRFIVLDPILFEEQAKFILECPRSMMLLLRLDVGAQRVQVGGTDGKAGVPALPRKVPKMR